MKRVFLGWGQVPLKGIVDFLMAPPDAGDILDLHHTAVLLPSGRAGRRLMELLVDHCAEGELSLVPPLFLTPGSIIETLYQIPSSQVADPLFDRLSWCEALEKISPEAAQRFALAAGSADFPFAVRWGLAETLGGIHRELAAQGLSFDEVATRLEQDGIVASVPETQRGWWQLMTEVASIRDCLLTEHHLVDRDRARWEGLEAPTLPRIERLVVACCPDLNAQVQRAIAAFPGTVEILIHAPPERAEGFSEVGTVIPEFWQNAQIRVPDKQLHITLDPRQEALAAVDYLSSIAPNCSVSECTLAPLTDESRRALHAQLDQICLPFIDAEAPPPALGTLSSWLRVATDFARTGGRAEAWRLLRHPHSQGLSPESGDGLHGMLDTINESCVQSAIPLHGNPHTFPASAAVEDVLSRLLALLEPFRDGEARPLSGWAAPLAELFDGCHLSPGIDAATHRSLEALIGLVRDAPPTAPIEGHNALRVVADAFSLVHTPETDSTAALDIVGWLELHLDDAPHLAITGVIEHAVPAVLNADPFLPNALRRELGLPSNESRLGRDSYLLAALLASRDTHLFLHRHHPDGSQTLPSRLLYRDSIERRISIARRFFLEQTPSRRPASPPLLPPSPEHFIPAHRPIAPVPSPLRLPITAIRAYLACPYRFYLRYLEKLEATQPPLCELDARLFGSLVHTTIQSLSSVSTTQLSSQRQLEVLLFAELDRAFTALVGSHPSSAARIQRDAARLRLSDFAQWQVAAVEEGWQPLLTEYSLDPVHTTVERAGVIFKLVGRIDRIEQNRFTGAYRIIDFKTGKQVPKTWSERGGWCDPQLPLYALLLARHPAFSSVPPETMQLCYVPLDGVPPIQSKCPELPPEGYDAVASLLDDTLTRIAAGIFWPPAPSQQFDDYATLIGTGYLSSSTEAL